MSFLAGRRGVSTDDVGEVDAGDLGRLAEGIIMYDEVTRVDFRGVLPPLRAESLGNMQCASDIAVIWQAV